MSFPTFSLLFPFSSSYYLRTVAFFGMSIFVLESGIGALEAMAFGRCASKPKWGPKQRHYALPILRTPVVGRAAQVEQQLKHCCHATLFLVSFHHSHLARQKPKRIFTVFRDQAAGTQSHPITTSRKLHSAGTFCAGSIRT